MGYAIKGLLISTLVMPGLGHFFLKRKLRGAMMMAGFLALSSVLITQVIRITMDTLNSINLNTETIDPVAISKAVTDASTNTSNLLPILLLVGWLAIAIDAYIIGRKLDLTNNQDRKD